MEFNDYQNQAKNTAIYPKDKAVVYPALGLAGEAGEVANKVKKVLRDGTEFKAVSNDITIWVHTITSHITTSITMYIVNFLQGNSPNTLVFLIHRFHQPYRYLFSFRLL